MLLEPRSLLSNSIFEANGAGPLVELGEERGKLLVVTLNIDLTADRHSLSVALWGSADGAEFGTRPLARFRPRQYSGIHSTLLNLAAHPEIAFLCVRWNIERHHKNVEAPPRFCFQVFLEESGARLRSARGLRSFTQSVGALKWPSSRGFAA